MQNRSAIFALLNINSVDCVHDNPYMQKATARIKGCQIDYLIQTRNKNLFVCEFKFKTTEIKHDIIYDMQNKVNRLSVPRNFAIVPVLFHISGVTESVLEKDYFYRIIDLATLLEPTLEDQMLELV